MAHSVRTVDPANGVGGAQPGQDRPLHAPACEPVAAHHQPDLGITQHFPVGRVRALAVSPTVGDEMAVRRKSLGDRRGKRAEELFRRFVRSRLYPLCWPSTTPGPRAAPSNLPNFLGRLLLAPSEAGCRECQDNHRPNGMPDGSHERILSSCDTKSCRRPQANRFDRSWLTTNSPTSAEVVFLFNAVATKVHCPGYSMVRHTHRRFGRKSGAETRKMVSRVASIEKPSRS